jgi:NADH-quinone oxidoreductase subunit H
MRFGWKFLIPVTLLWVAAVAFIKGAQLAFFGENTRMAALIVVGVFAAVALPIAWVWQDKHDAAVVVAERPEEIDPFAGGYPIPPLPGQRLREPSLQGARSLAGTAGQPELTDQEDTRG